MFWLRVPIKGSTVVVWDREGYIKKGEKQLGDEEIYEEVSDDLFLFILFI